MPKRLHRRLLLSARRQGLTGERQKAYVYGTMKRIEDNASKEVSKPKRRTQRSRP